MRLAGAGAAQADDVLLGGDELGPAEGQHAGLLEARLQGEVEALLGREAGGPQTACQAVFGARGDLGRQTGGQRLKMGAAGRGGIAGDLLEGGRQAGHLEPLA